jgi:hypothetical protein
MDQQKKSLVGIILHMIKEIYLKTTQLETVYDSNSIHLLSRDFDPLTELLSALGIPEDKSEHFSELIKLFIENEMTKEEIIIELQNHMTQLQK